MLFAAAGLKIGSLAVNLLRLVVGVVLLSVTRLLLRGTPFPFDAPGKALFFLSLSGFVGLALAYVLSKKGMGDNYDSLSATVIRMYTATLCMWLMAIFAGGAARVVKSMSNCGALAQTASGAVFGPYLGVWMSLFALNHTKTGIAATLMSLVPVFIIPAVMIVYRKMPTLRAVLGAVVAVAGVAILFLTKPPM
jgi:drug/metabolite transporter (DMT)-like permease